MLTANNISLKQVQNKRIEAKRRDTSNYRVTQKRIFLSSLL